MTRVRVEVAGLDQFSQEIMEMMILYNHTYFPGKNENSRKYHSRQPSKNDAAKDHNHASYLGKSENCTKKHILKESDTDPPMSGKYTQNQ